MFVLEGIKSRHVHEKILAGILLLGSNSQRHEMVKQAIQWMLAKSRNN